jgi:hypothetical protein
VKWDGRAAGSRTNVKDCFAFMKNWLAAAKGPSGFFSYLYDLVC